MAEEEMRNDEMALAAMSQYANSIGMTISSGIVTTMMNDAADGVRDGMMGSAQIMMGGKGGMVESSPLTTTRGGAAWQVQ